MYFTADVTNNFNVITLCIHNYLCISLTISSNCAVVVDRRIVEFLSVEAENVFMLDSSLGLFAAQFLLHIFFTKHGTCLHV